MRARNISPRAAGVTSPLPAALPKGVSASMVACATVGSSTRIAATSPDATESNAYRTRRRRSRSVRTRVTPRARNTAKRGATAYGGPGSTLESAGGGSAWSVSGALAARYEDLSVGIATSAESRWVGEAAAGDNC